MSFDEENHPSISKIKENMKPELSFTFSETEEHKVGKISQDCPPEPFDRPD